MLRMVDASTYTRLFPNFLRPISRKLFVTSTYFQKEVCSNWPGQQFVGTYYSEKRCFQEQKFEIVENLPLFYILAYDS